MPVRIERWLPCMLKQHLSVERDTGDHALCKEHGVAARTTEPAVVIKEPLSLVVVRLAGHHEPRNTHAVCALGGHDLLSKHSKERLASHWCCWIRALGAAPTEPCSLTAGDDERSNLAALYEVISDSAILVGIRHGAHVWAHWSNVSGRRTCQRCGLRQHGTDVLKRKLHNRFKQCFAS